MYSFSTEIFIGVALDKLSLTGQRLSTISSHLVRISILASVSGTKLSSIRLKIVLYKTYIDVIGNGTLIFTLLLLVKRLNQHLIWYQAVMGTGSIEHGVLYIYIYGFSIHSRNERVNFSRQRGRDWRVIMLFIKNHIIHLYLTLPSLLANQQLLYAIRYLTNHLILSYHHALTMKLPNIRSR